LVAAISPLVDVIGLLPFRLGTSPVCLSPSLPDDAHSRANPRASGVVGTGQWVSDYAKTRRSAPTPHHCLGPSENIYIHDFRAISPQRLGFDCPWYRFFGLWTIATENYCAACHYLALAEGLMSAVAIKNRSEKSRLF
jgi:hypothetical protein